MTSAPDVSIVIEWENVLLSESTRSEVLLQRLSQQIRGLQRSVEVIVVCNPVDGELAALEALLRQCLGPPHSNFFGWRTVVAPSAHHYELKNRGAASHSYVDAQGLYSRAVTLGWFFPLRSETSTSSFVPWPMAVTKYCGGATSEVGRVGNCRFRCCSAMARSHGARSVASRGITAA